MQKTALITGITGQDGSYLAELLLEKGYDVHGLVRRSSTGNNTANINHVKDQITFHYSDLTDAANLESIMLKVRPDEVYNLTGVSSVAYSFEHGDEALEANAFSVIRLFESFSKMGLENIKFFQSL